ncbi:MULTISPECIES: ABC transporter ATP-binding protein [Psychrobacter]|jgi:putative ABC transport system ATP-binding protein|uniref:ABC transporter ATP-binding protein n=1 Tax=Psychrobacter TaxID=497 RepID=UPI000E9D0DE3|nr:MULTISPECIES: ABC transporter ATP-binding protein [Psychrobacter]BBI69834.1 ABC transporter ATP-binding protein [Psychrobacter sp. KH172YL61]HBL96357.1 ABC transporter [Psychrobacter sp.]|tara:strand:+ start:370 stop:1086 length:717 start_codon:yes stop_codon:yes gene_type:complete
MTSPSTAPSIPPVDTEKSALLTASQLNKTVQVGEQKLSIIKDVDIYVNAGEFVVIMGKSGSGKSTLLGLLAALDYPDSGTVSLADQTLSSLDEDSLAVIRQQDMGFVFQSFHLLPTLTVAENIAFPLDIARRPNPARVNELIDAVDLGHRRHSLPNQLSGGEQQRTAVARALVSHPKIVFADEPTGNLDEQNADQVMQLLLNLRQQVGSALVVVTHDPALAEMADRVITMHDGRIVPT